MVFSVKGIGLREFAIRDVRFVNYRVALVGDTSIRLLSNLAQECIVAYPELS